jgi:hypothetical protein
MRMLTLLHTGAEWAFPSGNQDLIGLCELSLSQPVESVVELDLKDAPTRPPLDHVSERH